jgi:phage minor structural protein
LSERLWIFSKDEEFLTTLGARKGAPFYDAIHTEQINKENNFDFSVPADHEDSQHVVEENLVAFKDEDGAFQLFEMKEPETEHGEELRKSVFCQHVSLTELNDEIIEDIRPTDVTAHFALTEALNGTRWQVGTVDDLGTNSTNFYYESVMSAIQKILNTWGGEIRYRVEITGNAITARYIDILARRGADTGKRFVYSKDLVNVRRTVISTGVKTALYGRGKGEETGDGFGRRITFADVEWLVANGDPVDKPLGQEWVGDSDALSQFGRPNTDGTKRHREGKFEDSEETDAATLLQSTWDDLQKRKEPLTAYEMSVIDLEQDGREHEAVRLGDTSTAIDKKFVPELRVQARIVEIKRNLLEKRKTKVVLGNFLPLFTDDDTAERIEAKLNQKTGEWDDKYKPGNPLDTSWLDGIIDVLNNEVRSTGGYVYVTDTEGLVVYDKPKDQSPTKALRLKGGILAISNSKDVNGDFIYRTFGDGDGFVADELTSGKVKTSLVQIGVDSTFETDYDPSTKETPSGAQAKADQAETDAKSYTESWSEKKKVASTTAPSDTSVIWIDTSVTPNVPRYHNGTSWEKLSPTAAAEIGAETPSGAQSKVDTADSALRNDLSTGTQSVATSGLSGAIDVATNAIQQNSNFYWDSTGFYAIDPNDANKIVRITAGGVGVSDDGGQTFETSMTGQGVVAESILAGIIKGVEVIGSIFETVAGANGEKVRLEAGTFLSELFGGTGGERVKINSAYVESADLDETGNPDPYGGIVTVRPKSFLVKSDYYDVGAERSVEVVSNKVIFSYGGNPKATLAYWGTYLDFENIMARFLAGIYTEDWVYPSLQNGWINYGGSFSQVAYKKDPMGFVHIKGMVRSGTIGSACFTLPSGYIPSEQMTRVTNCDTGMARVDVFRDGQVYIQSGSQTWTSVELHPFYVG